jgi:hypothetical protein
MPSEEWLYYSSQLGFIKEQILSSVGASELEKHAPTVDRVDSATEQAIDDNDLDAAPTVAEIKAALDEFYALPEDLRRKMLHGWGMKRWPDYRDGLVGEPPPQQPHVVVTAGSRQPNGAASAHVDIVREDSTAPVQLHVRVGTRKRDALAALYDLWFLIETQWPVLTAERPLTLGDVPLVPLLQAADAS